MEGKELLYTLEKQIEEYCSNFIFYHIPFPPRKGPVVTVYLAELKPEEGGGFVRALGLCVMRDTPSKVAGRIAAAKRLLRTIKNGISYINPVDEEVVLIVDTLCNSGLSRVIAMCEGDVQWLEFLGGECGVTATTNENKMLEARKANRLAQNLYSNNREEKGNAK